MLKSRFLRRLIADSGKLLLIAILWLGGVGVLGAVSNYGIVSRLFNSTLQADGPINIWWPTENATVDNVQTFKGMVQDKDISQYKMTWSVDGGQENGMYDSYSDYPHKEAVVDLRSWTWRGNGPYKLAFKATDNSGAVLGERAVTIYTPGPAQGPTKVETGVTAISQVLSAAVPTVAAETKSNNGKADVNILWPTPNAVVEGTFALKAAVDTIPVDSYSMYWQVDNGQENQMYTVTTGGPHKEASVDVSGWRWKDNGMYTFTFTAKNTKSEVVGRKDVTVQVKNTYVQSATAGVSVSASLSKPQQEPLQINVPGPISVPETSIQVSGGNPLAGAKFYIDPNSNAKRQADTWRSSRPGDASQMDKIATNSSAIWLGGWNANVQSDVQNRMNEARAQGAVPIFIAYNIPLRDCGQYSAGGLNSPDGYRSWVRNIADGIGSGKAVVVLEPDALALTTCLSPSQTQDRFNLVSDAVSILKAKSNVAVYIDAGHPNWINASDMANRLNQAGISKADGFALNVSNFYTTASNDSYGKEISSKVGGKHFIVDTARNGLGPNGDQWCNPSGRALGMRPTASTGSSLVDAYLWLKTPGESDGNCNGGPNAGTWWPEYALGLAERAAY